MGQPFRSRVRIYPFLAGNRGTDQLVGQSLRLSLAQTNWPFASLPAPSRNDDDERRRPRVEDGGAVKGHVARKMDRRRRAAADGDD
ncbi:hypothetical protein MTO96_027596 [Rhipicephalus appendiculatus]